MWLFNFWLSWRVRQQTHSLTVAGRKRTYYVHVPSGLDSQSAAPIVVALHGATMNGPLLAWFTGLNQKADDAGFIAVYPNGTGTGFRYYWNGGDCCGSAVQEQVDDVAFIRAMLDDLTQRYRVDSNRIFITGLSNGAIMAYRLASELSDKIAAIAPVAGTMGLAECHPARPVPVLHFHGTEDKFVPLAGGIGSSSTSGVNHFSVEHSIGAWVRANGCHDEPIIEELPDTTKDGTKAIRKTYRGGKDGAEVILVVIEGGGHTWPGREPRSEVLGRSTKNVAANELMWEFFQRHPMK